MFFNFVLICLIEVYPPRMIYFEKKLVDVFSNGEGNFVDVSNLRFLLHYLGYRVDSERLKYILEKNALTKTKLSFEEVAEIRNQLEKVPIDEVASAFKYFNSEQTKEFDVKILKEVLKRGKDAFSQDEIDELVRNIDCDYEGNFNYEMLINKKLSF